MNTLKKYSLSDFFELFKIKADIDKKDFYLEKIIYKKKNKKLIINIIAEDVYPIAEIKKMKKKLKEYKIDVEINFNFLNRAQLDEREIIKKNITAINFILESMVPSYNINNKEVLEYEINNGDLIISIKEEVIIEKAIKRKVDKKINEFFIDIYNVKVNTILKFKGKDYNLEEYEKNRLEKEALLINEIEKNTIDYNNSVKEKKVENKASPYKKTKDPDIYYGREKLKDSDTIKISDIEEGSSNIIVKGEVISFEERIIKTGNSIFIIEITDYFSSITIKFWGNKQIDEDISEKIKEGACIIVKGDLQYDNFSKENIIMATAITRGQFKEDLDLSKEKRIELHLHTKMSSMDGMSNIKDLASQAKKWGHTAIALTDHGGIQAFPDAMNISADLGIKIIYGMEGYLVDDEEFIVDEINYSLDDTFIIFDIETTGLSIKSNEIIEIGAVKIKNGEIIDSFSHLIEPSENISEKIEELTGINNDMVKGKDKIEVVLKKFFDFIEDYPLVAHNIDFDLGFIREKSKNINKEIKNTGIDTLKLSRILIKDIKRHKLDKVAKYFDIKIENHHRALDDARATAKIFFRFIDILKEKNIFNLKDLNKNLSTKKDFKRLDTYHIIFLVKNYIGLKNLYKLVSKSHLDYFYKKPRIPKSLLREYREGLIIGSACEAGELYQGLLKSKDENYIEKIVDFYDYLEIQPLGNNQFLIDKGLLKSKEDLIDINKKIISLGETFNKPVVATCDVHFLNKRDEIYRRVLMTGQKFKDAHLQPPLFFRKTEDMLDEFNYLSEEKRYEVVIKNPNKINDMIDNIKPIPDGTFPPVIEGSDEDLRNMCYKKAKSIYGEELPSIVKDRLDKELNSIISNGYAVLYIISQKLVTKSLEDGYLVGSRGSVGSSFAATMSDITEVNPLPAHYVCSECKYSEFFSSGEYTSGYDLPNKKCPKCSVELIKEGQDIPFEVFLGFEGDKEPDIDLNFAGEYQSEAHNYTEELFGEGKVFRAGTIGTIADKTAYGFVMKYLDETEKKVSRAEINRLVRGCTGIKRTSGQHPGGVMIVPRDKDIHDFCPVQYPANDSKSGVITTHFDYNAISGRLLKLDILGHDVPTIIKMLEDLTNTNAQDFPLDDEKTLSIFTSTKALGLDEKDLGFNVGSLGIPEFGTRFVRQMLEETQPSTFGELVRISGLSHGAEVWLNNAQELVRKKIVKLKDVISTRDDIMNYLIFKGLPKKLSFKIMEKVRKGKGITEEEENLMKEKNVPDWYIESCKKIKYMFPKAHAAAYVTMSFRIAYYKVYYPEAFYATYFTTKAEDFNFLIIREGREKIKSMIKEIEKLGNDAKQKEKNLLTVLEVALEMNLRGIELLEVDIYKSDSSRFKLVENKLLPPLKTLDGLGENASKNIVKAREKSKFLSIEDLVKRAKINKTGIEALKKGNCLDGLSETNQLSLF